MSAVLRRLSLSAISLFVALLALAPRPAVAAAVSDGVSAHEAVVATGAPFAGWREVGSLIGMSQYWEASPIPGSAGEWAVVYTYGWGDCQAGCIDRHSWSFTVDAQGLVTYVGESGPALPADAPAALRAYPDPVPTPTPEPSADPSATPTPTETPGGGVPLGVFALLGLVAFALVALFVGRQRAR